MTPEKFKDEDTQERRRRHYEEYHPSLPERVTVLEQRLKFQLEHIKNEIENSEATQKERWEELKKANKELLDVANDLTLKVSELKIKSGIIGTIAGLITMVGFLIIQVIYKKANGG